MEGMLVVVRMVNRCLCCHVQVGTLRIEPRANLSSTSGVHWQVRWEVRKL